MLCVKENEFWMHPSAVHRYRQLCIWAPDKGIWSTRNDAYINENVPVQWCDIPGWELAWRTNREHTAGPWLSRLVLFLKREQRSGCSENNAEAKPAQLLCLDSKGKQGAGTEPLMTSSSLVTSADGQVEKRSLEELQHQEQHSGLGIPTCCSSSSQDVWFCPEVTAALQWLQGRWCTVRPILKTQCRPTHLYPYYCTVLSGTVFGELFVQIITGLNLMVFCFVLFVFFHTRIRFCGYRIS